MANILIGYSACPLTRTAFEAHGHNVFTCDLLPARGDSSKHIQGDIWEALNKKNADGSPFWQMAVLHPMCTYLTTSGAWAFSDPDFEKYPGKGYHQKPKADTLTGEARRNARGEALANFGKLLELPFPVAIENPARSYISAQYGKASCIVQPYQFGDDASKATGFWLTKGLPPLEPTERVDGRIVEWQGKWVERWANQTDTGQNKLAPGENRWLERSATYPGIAAAMGDQWGKLF